MRPGFDYIGVTTAFYCHDGEGRFLLHRRGPKARDERGKWDFGAGEMEFGETPVEAVMREVREEYGCQGWIDEMLPPHSVIREIEGEKIHWLAIPFIVRVNPKSVKIVDTSKIDDWGWYQIKFLPSPLHPGPQITLDRHREIFNRYVKPTDRRDDIPLWQAEDEATALFKSHGKIHMSEAARILKWSPAKAYDICIQLNRQGATRFKRTDLDDTRWMDASLDAEREIEL